jgi:hypothetical protein
VKGLGHLCKLSTEGRRASAIGTYRTFDYGRSTRRVSARAIKVLDPEQKNAHPAATTEPVIPATNAEIAPIPDNTKSRT